MSEAQDAPPAVAGDEGGGEESGGGEREGGVVREEVVPSEATATESTVEGQEGVSAVTTGGDIGGARGGGEGGRGEGGGEGVEGGEGGGEEGVKGGGEVVEGTDGIGEGEAGKVEEEVEVAQLEGEEDADRTEDAKKEEEVEERTSDEIHGEEEGTEVEIVEGGSGESDVVSSDGVGFEGVSGEVGEVNSGNEEVQTPEKAQTTDTPITESLAGDRVGVVTTPPATPPATTPDSRLHSGSRMGLQPPPLGDIAEVEGEEVVEEEAEEEDREKLILSCKEALTEQRRLRSENSQLQHRIAGCLAARKMEERPDPGRSVADLEIRYFQHLGALEELKGELAVLKGQWAAKEQWMGEHCEEKQRQVQEELEEFLKYQREVSVSAVDSRSGRRLTAAEVTKRQDEQHKRDQAVFQARLENIKLTNKIEKLESLLKQKEELGEGMHMIDFEQLKINNVDLTEKIEERNEDIAKLVGKVKGTVQVLTHVKEKLHFLQDENSQKREKLSQLDAELAMSRDQLTHLKQAKDSLRLDNQRLKHRGGLVSHSALLSDFEERQDQNEEQRERLRWLQEQYSQLSLQCKGLRRKTEQSRALHHT